MCLRECCRSGLEDTETGWTRPLEMTECRGGGRRSGLEHMDRGWERETRGNGRQWEGEGGERKERKRKIWKDRKREGGKKERR